MDSIGKRLRYARIFAQLTIPEVSVKTGISKGNLSRLENDINKPSSEALVSLSELYGLSIDWILKGESSGNYVFSGNRDEFLIVSDKKLKTFLQGIVTFWSESDKEVRSWVIVQLNRAFPEVSQKLKNDNSDNKKKF